MVLRNAELSQELLTVKKTLQDERLALEKEIKGRIEAENIQQQKCDQLQESCDKLREEVYFIQLYHQSKYSLPFYAPSTPEHDQKVKMCAINVQSERNVLKR